eukprot:Hpha_TRINITY_DN19458_c0_g1::TRINITY_DN19458_c0_g1_i1::g.45709::m.45709
MADSALAFVRASLRVFPSQNPFVVQQAVRPHLKRPVHSQSPLPRVLTATEYETRLRGGAPGVASMMAVMLGLADDRRDGGAKRESALGAEARSSFTPEALWRMYHHLRTAKEKVTVRTLANAAQRTADAITLGTEDKAREEEGRRLWDAVAGQLVRSGLGIRSEGLGWDGIVSIAAAAYLMPE